MSIHSAEHGTMLRGRHHLMKKGLHASTNFDLDWNRFMARPRTAPQIVAFKDQMKAKYAAIYQHGRPATRPFTQPAAGILGKLGKLLRVTGFGLLLQQLLSTDAAAAQLTSDLSTLAEDCAQGREDWAYVDLLVLRHHLNQQAAFSGDIATSQLLW